MYDNGIFYWVLAFRDIYGNIYRENNTKRDLQQNSPGSGGGQVGVWIKQDWMWADDSWRGRGWDKRIIILFSLLFVYFEIFHNKLLEIKIRIELCHVIS